MAKSRFWLAQVFLAQTRWSVAIFFATIILFLLGPSLITSASATCASTGNTPLLRLVLATGIGVDATDSDEAPITPLMCAAQNGKLGAVRLLLDHGANVNQIGFLGMTPLTAAGDGGNAEIIRLLLAKGADINAKTTNRGDTALLRAVQGGHTEAVRVLIEHGASLTMKSNGCGSVYDCAHVNGDRAMLDLLASKGVTR